jgi:hypothetical protein
VAGTTLSALAPLRHANADRLFGRVAGFPAGGRAIVRGTTRSPDAIGAGRTLVIRRDAVLARYLPHNPRCVRRAVISRAFTCNVRGAGNSRTGQLTLATAIPVALAVSAIFNGKVRNELGLAEIHAGAHLRMSTWRACQKQDPYHCYD